MKVLVYARHRYPARRDDGTGLEPRTDPSGAPNHVLDLLARGLAEEGLDVTYLLPAGADEPLPDGVRLATAFEDRYDVLHNLEAPGRPWFVTVHGHRPPGGYYDRVDGDQLMPAPGRGTEPPWELPAGAICVSRTLAETFGGGRWILNGMDPAELEFSATKDDYLLFLAGMQGPSIPDIWRHKGLEDALALSRELEFRLVVAGTVREREVGERIAAMCADAGASYLGDVRGGRKAELLAGARALLFPTRLHEGCPLVIIEALMSGTPVVASDRGACPELVTPDVGFVCGDRAAYADAIGRLGEVDPGDCRERALERFHYRRMAAEYAAEYELGLRGILAPSMAQENVKAFRRAVDAYNRRDIDAFLEDFDPEVEWHPLTQVMFGGDLTVYRGHEDIRRFMREVDEALAEVQIEDVAIRDLGDRLVVTGRLRARGKASGAEIESPIGWVVEFKHGKVALMRDYSDPKDAFAAVGLRE